MSPYTTPMVVSVSGSNARAEGRGWGGAEFGAGSAASAMVGSTEGPRENTLPGRTNASELCRADAGRLKMAVLHLESVDLVSTIDRFPKMSWSNW